MVIVTRAADRALDVTDEAHETLTPALESSRDECIGFAALTRREAHGGSCGYACAHPEPPDVRLLIEVADSSVRYDRLTKFPLYARAGIADAWLVDVDQRRVEVHRGPGARGYQDVRAPGRDDHFSPLAFPDISVTLTDLLG